MPGDDERNHRCELFSICETVDGRPESLAKRARTGDGGRPESSKKRAELDNDDLSNLLELEAAGEDPEKAIDLVLMDVMMPVMDGLTAARTIRSEAKWAKLPIIMLTAKAMPDDQQNCLDAGANDYMAKPIDVDKLLSLVRVWMPR